MRQNALTQPKSTILALCALLISMLTFAMSLLPAAQGANAAPPEQESVTENRTTFAYQGTLRDSNGKLLSGIYNLTFAIYDQPIEGTILHKEIVLGVIVRDGNFNVILGTDSFIPLSPLVFAAQPRYIGIAVQPDPEMSPRQEIHPVPMALTANSALTVNAIEAIRDAGATDTTSRIRSTYAVNTKRYILEALDQGTTFDGIQVDDTILTDFCQDLDGCSITLGMRDWDDTKGNGALVSIGPQRFATASAINNQRYFERVDSQGQSVAGWDGDNNSGTIWGFWDCYLADHKHIDGVAQSDSTMDLYFYNSNGNYNSSKMVCVLMIED